jgi:NTP pyrophosphatase (non-canonical NTP hydrolase)
MIKKNLDFFVEKIKEFNHARGWHQPPQDNAKSIVIEAAELLEHFQWSDHKKKDLADIKKEAADVFWYLVAFCHESGFELIDAVKLKYKHNAVKYPVEMFQKKNHEKLYYQRKAEYRQKQK